MSFRPRSALACIGGSYEASAEPTKYWVQSLASLHSSFEYNSARAGSGRQDDESCLIIDKYEVRGKAPPNNVALLFYTIRQNKCK